MSEIKLEINKYNSNEWNKILNQFEDANIFQTWAYGKYSRGGEKVQRVVLKIDNKIVSLAQIRVATIPVIEKNIAYLYWGPIWKLKDEKLNEDILSTMLDELKKEYVNKRKWALKIDPQLISTTDLKWKNLFLQKGFNLNTHKPQRRTFLLDLTQDYDKLVSSLSQNWRRNLRKAEKNNLEIIRTTDLDLLQEFITNYADMVERKKIFDMLKTIDYYQLQKDLEPNEKLKIILCKKDEEFLGGLVSSSLGNMGLNILGTTVPDSKYSIGVYHLLHMEMAKSLKEEGCTINDLGGIDPEENPGGYQFKNGMRGEDVSFLNEFESTSNLFSRGTLKLIDVLKDRKTKVGALVHHLMEILPVELFSI